jgi:hypothetical protein
VKLVLTLLARNEADIVDSHVAFHLHAGVDLVIATDNGSKDATTEILERYERTGRLHLIREEGDDMRQDEWVTRMARLAATEYGADWVINSDADEFWWPREGSLKEVFATVPERYGVVRGCWRHFPPRPDDGRLFAERMIVRLARPAHPGDKRTIFHAHQKVAHRGDPDIWVERGNHNAHGARDEPLRGWHPLEVLHFSLRSASQVASKATGGWVRSDYEAPQHQLAVSAAGREGRAAEYYLQHVVTDDDLDRGRQPCDRHPSSGRAQVAANRRRRVRAADRRQPAPVHATRRRRRREPRCRDVRSGRHRRRGSLRGAHHSAGVTPRGARACADAAARERGQAPA